MGERVCRSSCARTRCIQTATVQQRYFHVFFGVLPSGGIGFRAEKALEPARHLRSGVKQSNARCLGWHAKDPNRCPLPLSSRYPSRSLSVLRGGA